MGDIVKIRDGRDVLRKAGLSKASEDSHRAGIEDDDEFELGLYHVPCNTGTLQDEVLTAADAIEGTTVSMHCAKCKKDFEASFDPNDYGQVFAQMIDKPNECELWW